MFVVTDHNQFMVANLKKTGEWRTWTIDRRRATKLTLSYARFLAKKCKSKYKDSTPKVICIL